MIVEKKTKQKYKKFKVIYINIPEEPLLDKVNCIKTISCSICNRRDAIFNKA